MKKTYTKPNMEIVSFKTENIITTSAASLQAESAFGTLTVTSSGTTVSY